MTLLIHDETPCLLGEGPLWHPERGELFWFDILGRRLHGAFGARRLPWIATAAGWVDRDTLLVARVGGLDRYDIATGRSELVVPLAADQPGLRPNDGRADPWGGFWIGTMGLGLETQVGAYHRYHQGELRLLIPNITIPNATCFDAPRARAYWTDTPTMRLMRQRLDEADGWPVGEPEVHHAFVEGDNPDGAVTDADGNVWIALWGAGRVAVIDPEGREIASHPVPARQVTCTAFGGADFGTLYVTSAAVALAQPLIAREPDQGRTFALTLGAKGLPEPKVVL